MRGKKIWLIGASEGIGKCLAEALAKEGAMLAVSARQADKLDALAQTISALALPADVQNMSSLASAYEALRRTWGMPDIVIYNAGYYEPMTAQQFNLAEAEKMQDINFNGCMRMLSHVLPDFIKGNKGHLVLVGSIAAYRGLPGAIGYGASKAALLHLAENLAVDLYGSGVKVQVVSPGFVRTRLTAKNNFHMPGIIEPERAAREIISGMKGNAFEIRFPFVFPTVLRWLSFLPAKLYFAIVRDGQSKPVIESKHT
ncbi:MAG: SDR family NAD(P)-dependent oxidoreductase [Alphaproteobacteria bacterium]|nr:SDR family NAD(P)-dependent oxidoreductase [Alphaproteobacteria bacterium]